MIELNHFYSHIDKLFKAGKLQDLFTLLDDGNYVMEIYLDYLFSSDNVNGYFFWDKKNIAYLYNYQIYNNRVELTQKIISTRPVTLREQFIKDLLGISSKLIFYYRTKIFNQLEELLIDFNGEHFESYKNAEGLDANSVNFAFSIRGINVFFIEGNGCTEEEIFNEEFDYSHFNEKVANYSDFINITSLDFYVKLDDETKMFLKAGSQLVNLVMAKTDEPIYDHSPLLINFVKAVEYETKILFSNYSDDIILKSRYFKDYLKTKQNADQEIKEDRELGYLRSLSGSILRFKKNYSPSGIKPLYYFLKYYAVLDKDLIVGYDGFLPHDKQEHVEKSKNLISRLLSFGELRNDYIHSKMIESKEEFLMNYTDLVLTLQLLINLKP